MSECNTIDGFPTTTPVYVIVVMLPGTNTVTLYRVATSWVAACAFFELNGMNVESEPGASHIQAYDKHGASYVATRMEPVRYSTPATSKVRAEAIQSMVQMARGCDEQ